MATTNDYLANIPQPQQDEYKRVRKIVMQIVPNAEETISYGMPTFRYDDRPLVYFGAFKNHMSLFPTPGPAETLKDKLKDYKVSKGTIQFTSENPLSDELIREIINARLAEIS